MGSCAAPSAKGDDKFITTDYLQQCPLNHVWREGYRYMKAGVMLADFTPSGIAQPGLFDEIQPRKNSEKLMKTLDELNQSGKGKVWFAGRGTAPEWQMKREMLSQCYTTKWRDIPLARLG